MTALVRYEAARHALKVAHSVDEVKDIRDKAQAMAAYARQAQDTAMVEWATEIKVRAERRAGELTRELEKKPGKRKDLTSPHDAGRLSKAEVLADAGVSTQTASRWERLAAVPEDQFEQAVAAAKEVAGEVTTSALLKANQSSKAKPAESETVPRAKYDALVAELVEKDELIKDLRFELNDLNEIQKGDHAKQMALLRASLKDANRARDDAMNDANQKNKQCQHYLKELTKLGWKKK